MKLLDRLPLRKFFHKIFNKLFLVYLLAYLLSMALLSVALSAYLEQAFINREVEYMNVAVGEAISYIDNNVQLADKMIFNTYIECYNNRSIYDFMTRNYADDSDSFYRKSFVDYISNLVSSRDDLKAITYYRNADKGVFTTIGNVRTSAEGSAPVDALLASGEKSALLKIPGSKQNDGYYYVKQFNNIYSWMPIGYITLEYRSDGLQSILKKFIRNFQCDFIITSNHSVLYEMNKAQDGDSPFPNDELNAVQTGSTYTLKSLGGTEYYIIGKELSSLKVKVFCIIPRSEIKRYVRPTQMAVFVATLAVGLLFIIMLSVGNRVFSRRMNDLIEQIGNIRKGNLTVKSKVANKADELGIISSHFNDMCSELQEYINKTYRYELKQKDAEYKLLQMQINPHFLFNTLEAIRMKAAIEGFGDASQMIYSLSLLLRQTTKPTSVNTLKDEIAFCKLYLDLFTLKFEQGLIYEFHVAEGCEECGIIRHIIQPLLENSIVHGFKNSEDLCRLTVSASREGDILLIRIQDNGLGMDEETCAKWNARLLAPADEGADEGIGLHNVNDRIRFIYGTGYGITLNSKQGQGTEVLVRLRYLSCQEVMDLVQPANR